MRLSKQGSLWWQVCRSAEKHARGLIRNLQNNRAALEKSIQARLAAATKDNDTVYYDGVPKANTIPDVDSKVIESLLGSRGAEGEEPEKRKRD